MFRLGQDFVFSGANLKKTDSGFISYLVVYFFHSPGNPRASRIEISPCRINKNALIVAVENLISKWIVVNRILQVYLNQGMATGACNMRSNRLVLSEKICRRSRISAVLDRALLSGILPRDHPRTFLFNVH